MLPRCWALLLWQVLQDWGRAESVGSVDCTYDPHRCEETVVQTALGPVLGLSADGVSSFKGIPFAEPPELFRPAVPKKRWGAHTLNATKYGDKCLQTGVMTKLADGFTSHDRRAPAALIGSTDCLTLNIWTSTGSVHINSKQRPRRSGEQQLLPVMVYVHGGGFNIGSAHSYGSTDELAYDGTALARHGIVVVTIQYRLGALGFFSHQGLSTPADLSTGGMNGIRDQIVALQFVRNHIATFGGDPQQVTINGQSAGAESTCVLMVSPLARGLFHRMMAQSGECIGPWGPHNQTQGIQASATLMKTLGVSTLDKMKQLSPSAIVSAGGSFYAIDGVVMPTMPIDLWKRPSAFNAKEMLLGSVTLDGMQGPGPSLWSLFPLNLTGSGPSQQLVMGETFGPNFRAVEREYPLSRFSSAPGSLAPIVAIARPNSDWDVGCPMVDMADLLTTTGGDAYFYIFGCSTGFCSHGYELPYVFGNGAVAGFPGPQVPMLTGPYSQEFAELTMRLWSNFVKGGNPTPPSEPRSEEDAQVLWPKFNNDWWSGSSSGSSQGVPGMYIGGGAATPHGSPPGGIGSLTPGDCIFWPEYNPFA